MSSIRQLLEYGKDRKSFLVLSMILSGVATIFSFIPYYFFWKILFEINTSANISRIWQLSFIIFATTIVYIVTYFFSLICSHVFAFRVETNMRKIGLEHLLNASFSFFDYNSSGRTRKIIDDNASNTHTIIAHILPDSVNAVLFPICLIVLAFIADLYVGILVVVTIILALICFKFMFGTEASTREYMDALEDINSGTVEYIRGIQVIKIFNTYIKSYEKLYKSIKHYSVVVNKQCQNCKIPFNIFETLMFTFGVTIIFIVYNRVNIVGERPNIISLVIFVMTFIGLLHNAFMKIMFFSRYLQMANDAINKSKNLFEDMKSNKLVSGSVDKIEKHNITFEDVTFGYDKDQPILKNFNLELPENRIYALIGSSGSGKSTIAKLISGFYPVTEGFIKIGGRDIREYTQDALNENISFVFQNAKLFKSSIYENVKIGRPNSSYEEVMKALELAMCNDILDKFETRENTIIGAKGVYLSGGETQRITIARAILKNAPIIILDEASAASDPENEYKMQLAFSTLIKNKTVVMIAHRLTSIKNVDEILVVDNGEIVQRGSHKELIEKNGKYKHFIDLYDKANIWRL